MKRTKKIFSVLLVAALAAASVLSAASCAGDVHEHTLRQMKAKEATCFEDGNLAYWECTECKKLFADAEGEDEVTAEEVTLPAHHTPQFIAAVKGDGTFETSSIAHYVCTVCGSMFANEACTLPLTSEEVYEIKTYALSDARVAVSNGTNAVKAYVDGAQTTLSVAQLTFGLRIFLGWETDGCVADEAKYSPEPYRLNLISIRSAPTSRNFTRASCSVVIRTGHGSAPTIRRRPILRMSPLHSMTPSAKTTASISSSCATERMSLSMARTRRASGISSGNIPCSIQRRS